MSELDAFLANRRIDALLHRIFVAPVLVTGRGPFADGIAVPSYSCSVDAASMLLEAALPDWSWSVSSAKARVQASVSNEAGTLTHSLSLARDNGMTPAACLVAVFVDIENAARSVGPNCLPSSEGENYRRLAERAAEADYRHGLGLDLSDALALPGAPCPAYSA